MPSRSMVHDVFFTVACAAYVRAGGGWLATQIVVIVRPAPMQPEEYGDWNVDVPLPEAMFDVKQWSTAPHWARRP